MTNRTDWIQPQTFDPNRKRAERRLAANLDLASCRDGLTKRRVQSADVAILSNLPTDNVAALDVESNPSS